MEKLQTYRARGVIASDVALIRDLIAANPGMSRRRIKDALGLPLTKQFRRKLWAIR